MHWRILILVTVLLTSCVEISNNEFLTEVDEMISKVDSLETKHRSAQISNLQAINNWSDSVDLKIRKLFKPVPYDIGKKITAFAELRNNLEPFISSDSLIHNRLIRQKTQLVHLKSDIENGSGKRSLYNDYIAVEKSNLDTLSYLIHQRDSIGKRIILTFKELEDNLDSNLNEIFLRE